jgi:hypothetical protein
MRTVKETSRLSKIAIYCAIAAIASELFFCVCTFVLLHSIAGIGVLGFMLFSIAAFVFGILAIVVITFRHKVLKGYILAILAIIISAPALMLGNVTRRMTKSYLEREKANTGKYNLKVLGKSLANYAKDHDGYLPTAEHWCDELMEYDSNLTKDNFRHPRHELLRLGICNFAFNKNLGGRKLSEIDGDVVLLSEADGDWNLTTTGGSEVWRAKKKFGKIDTWYIDMLFVDGRIEAYWFHKNAIKTFDSKGMHFERLRWRP